MKAKNIIEYDFIRFLYIIYTPTSYRVLKVNF